MFNYGIQWNKFSDLMSYCEVQTESLLQAILTLAIAIPFSVGIRNPSYSQWVSGYASLTMVIARLSKNFLPPELWNHHEKSLMTRMKSFIWTIFITYILVLKFLIGYLVIFCFFVKCFSYLTSTFKIISIILISLLLISLISIIIFQRKNCVTPPIQTKLKCILLSAYFFVGSTTTLALFSFVLSSNYPFFRKWNTSSIYSVYFKSDVSFICVWHCSVYCPKI